jgi:hypothetical protein
MTCVHLRQLYKLCEDHDLKLSGSDLIRVVCNQCGEQEVCPSTLASEYDAKLSKQAREAQAESKPSANSEQPIASQPE